MSETTTSTESSTVPTGDQSAHIASLLAIACQLIEIEANDHRSSYSASPKQRKAISETLFSFTTQARAVLDQGTSSDAHGNQAVQAPAVEAKGA